MEYQNYVSHAFDWETKYSDQIYSEVWQRVNCIGQTDARTRTCENYKAVQQECSQLADEAVGPDQLVSHEEKIA